MFFCSAYLPVAYTSISSSLCSDTYKITSRAFLFCFLPVMKMIKKILKPNTDCWNRIEIEKNNINRGLISFLKNLIHTMYLQHLFFLNYHTHQVKNHIFLKFFTKFNKIFTDQSKFFLNLRSKNNVST